MIPAARLPIAFIGKGELRVSESAVDTEQSRQRRNAARSRKLPAQAPAEVRHGTTVGTNALFERKGARVAFITTAGFEDTIAIGRQARPKLYDLFFQKEEPLAGKDLRFGVAERVAADGTMLRRGERGGTAAAARGGATGETGSDGDLFVVRLRESGE